jgi:hypothetical protein
MSVQTTHLSDGIFDRSEENPGIGLENWRTSIKFLIGRVHQLVKETEPGIE